MNRPPILAWAAVSLALAVPLYVGLWLLGGPCSLSAFITETCATMEKAHLVSMAYGFASVFVACWPAWWLCLRVMRR